MLHITSSSNLMLDHSNIVILFFPYGMVKPLWTSLKTEILWRMWTTDVVFTEEKTLLCQKRNLLNRITNWFFLGILSGAIYCWIKKWLKVLHTWQSGCQSSWLLSGLFTAIIFDILEFDIKDYQAKLSLGQRKKEKDG